MMNLKKIIFSALLVSLCNACQTKVEPQPTLVPVMNTPQPKLTVKHPLGIIGAVEPVHILPMKSSFPARIDTGAKISSIDVEDYHLFERDGSQWVSFSVKNSHSGELYRFEKPLKDIMVVRRIKENERRPIVVLTVKFGGKTIKADFTLAKREKFEYQALIGRNILTGRAVVDTALSNTLR